ncbi:hypothetical protein IQ07DRAFT_419418 [Pyrenochaeta sp. DS3sAY3a]|nr:hypothetical protein IQ07DRAFT_419418 [Pyrenochaeta sp. DS3sAY3a]
MPFAASCSPISSCVPLGTSWRATTIPRRLPVPSDLSSTMSKLPVLFQTAPAIAGPARGPNGGDLDNHITQAILATTMARPPPTRYHPWLTVSITAEKSLEHRFRSHPSTWTLLHSLHHLVQSVFVAHSMQSTKSGFPNMSTCLLASSLSLFPSNFTDVDA